LIHPPLGTYDVYVQVDTWVEESTLSGYAVLVLNDATKDVDGKFVEALKQLVLDTKDEKTIALTFSGQCKYI
jgi:hypothetical protein